MEVLEYLKYTNQTVQRVKRHVNFVGPIRLPSCALVQTQPYELQCTFVTETPECGDNVYIFNYFEFLYCFVAPTNNFWMFIGIILLVIICSYLFMILGTTADGFFCPALQVVSNILGMSENVAGVTLLAFGNGAPDLFTSFAGLSGETRTIYSDIFGAGFFVVSVVGGTIIAFFPFTVQAASCLRDICFYLLDVLFIDYCVKAEKTITILESLMILGIYLMFLIVVIVDQMLLIRTKKRMEEDEAQGRGSVDSAALKAITSEAGFELLNKTDRKSVVNTERMASVDSNSQQGPNYNLLEQFKESLSPFEDDWDEGSPVTRINGLLKVPVLFVLKFLIPVVDFEMPRNGWSKLLNCMQIIILPAFVIIVLFSFSEVFGIPMYLYTLPISVPLALFTFAISRTDRPPRLHKYLSCLAAVGSVFTVYGCAAEIISILDVLGVTTYRSNSYLGCTMLAWGNSIGDLVANTALARQGYHKMGFAACLGGPLFNSLMSIGIAFTYKSLYDPESLEEIGEGTMGENCSIQLIILLFAMLLALSSTNFVLRRSIGIFMLSTYLTYMTFATLGEFEIIHTYGSDHRQDLKAEPADYT